MDVPKQQNLDVLVERISTLPYVKAILLFGSHARGTARFDSDIDIAVITKNATEKQEFDTSRITFAQTPYFSSWASKRNP